MKSAIQPFDFYLLRLPVLPISGLRELHACGTPEELAGAVHRLYQEAGIQEAIYLASPELHAQLLKWLAKPPVAPAGEDERLVLTLYKYLLRMSSRSTPYGLFAGFNTGRIAPEPTQLRLAEAAQRARKHARLDMNYVAELNKQVIADPVLKTRLRFFVNNSLYKTPDGYRYYEYYLRNKRRSYNLVAIKASVYVDQVLAAAWHGAPYQHLHDALTAGGIAPEAATTFLGRLIESQALLSELEPTVTGPEFYSKLVEKVQEIGPAHHNLGQLQAIEALLGGAATGIDTYQAVEQVVKQSFPAATSKNLIQTDLHLAMAHNTLSQHAVQLLSQDLEALSVLHKSEAPSDLRTFAQSFAERYEEQEIPLLEALDSEAGLGYGTASTAKVNHTPLVSDVRVPGKAAAQQVAWSAYRQLVFRKFQESEQGQQRVALTDHDLRALAPAAPVALPATFYALGSLVAASAEALDRGEFKFQLSTCHGPGAMALMARFAHADPLLAAKLVACGQHEQAAAGEALLAEVVHLPEARVGNILQRPQLRDYEIPFLGNSSVPADKQLPVSDLLVSVRQGKVVLRSQRLGKVVLPRLTTAHNYSGGLSVYKFLCDLQHQEDAFSLYWDWGVLQSQPHLPRIEYKHLIVSRERWRLAAEAAPEAAAATTPGALAAFRHKYQLPQQVLLADGDNELLLDFACPLALQLLAQRLRKGPATLFEFVHREASQLLTDDQQGSYLNEVLIPFANGAAAPAKALAPAGTGAEVRRSFALGSEWTYLKVYCGAKWADKILADYLRPCISELQELGLIEEWFFIRYADPKPHLRLRFRHPAEPARLAHIVSRLHQALAGLQQERVVRAIQYDTYYRELERYGRATMAFSETVFYHDSQAVLGFLNLIEGDEGERYRWLFALRGVDKLLTDFGFSLAEKAQLAEQSQRAFFLEFNGTPDLTRRLNDKYREVSREVSGFLNPANDTPDVQEAWGLFEHRSAGIAAARQQLAATAALPPAALDEALRRLVPSYLHMFLNRIFLANQRLHELVVYHYLTKHYASLKAQAKQAQVIAY